MRIAQIAPLIEAVPPKWYGGTERLVSYLTEALVELGHDVTLFASGDSITKAKLEPVCPQSLRLSLIENAYEEYSNKQLQQVLQRAQDFDILHFHIAYYHFAPISQQPTPSLTTLHWRLHHPELPAFFEFYNKAHLVSISDSQRSPLPHANWLSTVYHGLPEKLLMPNTSIQPGYLAFLGLTAPEKGVDTAIAIAAQCGLPIKIAAKIDKADQAYFDACLRPLMAQPHVEFIGEIAESHKADFLSGALALLCPINQPEPFGLVMIEAMACGTPVIAYNQGSPAEVIEHGVTGFVVNDEREAVDAVKRLPTLNRATIRQRFEARFTAQRMAQDYVAAYEKIIRSNRVEPIDRHPAETRSCHSETVSKDATVLAKALIDEPEDAHAVFSLAQRWRDAGELDKARDAYRKRATMGGCEEEGWYSLYEVANLSANLGAPAAEVVSAYLAAYAFRSCRAESLVALATWYRGRSEWALALLFARMARTIAKPDDTLFLDACTYRWRADDETAIAAYWLGHVEASFALCWAMLDEDRVPEGERARIEYNSHFAVPALLEKAIRYPKEIVQQLANPNRGQGEGPGVTLTIALGQQPNRFEETVNSFLNNCQDIERIQRFVCLVDHLNLEERGRWSARYPFFEFMEADTPDTRPAQCLNHLLETVATPYWLYLESGWQFFLSTNYVSRAIAILDIEATAAQVLFNRNYACTLEDRSLASGVLRRHPQSTLRYVVHEYLPERQERQASLQQDTPGALSYLDWPHFALRPSLMRTDAIRNIGHFTEATCGFEKAFAYSYMIAGWHSTFFDSLACVYTAESEAVSQEEQPLQRALRAHAQAPDNLAALRAVCEALIELAREDELLKFVDKALALDPRDMYFVYWRAQALMLLSRHHEVLATWRHYAALPWNAAYYAMHLGGSFIKSGDIESGLLTLERARNLAAAEGPEGLHIAHNVERQYGDALLRMGRPAGFAHSVVHSRSQSCGYWPDDLPIWSGEQDLRGKRVLVTHQFGFGDQFLMYACLTYWQAAGATLMITCDAELLRLLQASLPECVVVSAPRPWACHMPLPETLGPAIHDFVPDMHTTLLHLPILAAQQVPVPVPYFGAYLQAPADEKKVAAQWAQPLRARHPGKALIGIFWECCQRHFPEQGIHGRSIGERRSLPLHEVERLVTHPSVQNTCHFVTLHHPQFQNLAGMPSANISSYTPGIHDFADTAACMEQLDAVIAVDSGPANLSVMLGKPTLVPLQTVSDWRWDMQGAMSPWISNAKTLRQTVSGDWSTVVDEAILILAEMTQAEKKWG